MSGNFSSVSVLSPTAGTSLDLPRSTTKSHVSEVHVSKLSPLHKRTPLRLHVVYSGIEGAEGTGDIWAVNTLVTQLAGSGDYTAQGIELDFNNENAHRG